MTKSESSKQIFLVSVAWMKHCHGRTPALRAFIHEWHMLSDQKHAALNYIKYSANQSWDLLILYVQAVVQ